MNPRRSYIVWAGRLSPSTYSMPSTAPRSWSDSSPARVSSDPNPSPWKSGRRRSHRSRRACRRASSSSRYAARTPSRSWRRNPAGSNHASRSAGASCSMVQSALLGVAGERPVVDGQPRRLVLADHERAGRHRRVPLGRQRAVHLPQIPVDAEPELAGEAVVVVGGIEDPPVDRAAAGAGDRPPRPRGDRRAGASNGAADSGSTTTCIVHPPSRCEAWAIARSPTTVSPTPASQSASSWSDSGNRPVAAAARSTSPRWSPMGVERTRRAGRDTATSRDREILRLDDATSPLLKRGLPSVTREDESATRPSPGSNARRTVVTLGDVNQVPATSVAAIVGIRRLAIARATASS